jgi:hypothetical protein
MSGLINIDVHNNKVKMLEGLKPKSPMSVFSYVGNTLHFGIKLHSDSVGEISNNVDILDGNYRLTQINISNLRLLAACTIKAFGSITQEELDSVKAD